MSLGIHLAGSSRAGLGIARTDAVVQNMVNDIDMGRWSQCIAEQRAIVQCYSICIAIFTVRLHSLAICLFRHPSIWRCMK